MDFILHQYNAFEPNALIAFGLFLLFGVLGGAIASSFSWLPTITAFMTVGFICGPYGLDILSRSILSDSGIFIDIGLGLVLYKLGNTLHPVRMIRSKALLSISFGESILTFLTAFIAVRLFGNSVVISALVAAIAISSSPAFIVRIPEEMGAKGPITTKAQSLVAMNNILSFIIFTAVLPFALSWGQADVTHVLILPLYRMISAILIGISVAWLSTYIANKLKNNDRHYLFAIVAGGITITLGLAMTIGASFLFSALSLGIATRWLEKRRCRLSNIRLSQGGDLFFIILFVVAGAKLDIKIFIESGVLPFVLVLVRTISKFACVFVFKRLYNYSSSDCLATSLLVLPMAGMSIGLLTTLQDLVPTFGDKVSNIILAMITFLEIIGPFATVAAIRLSGESHKVDPGRMIVSR
jgi:Kef-type K+ transport system membrane component KefB